MKRLFTPLLLAAAALTAGAAPALAADAYPSRCLLYTSDAADE